VVFWSRASALESVASVNSWWPSGIRSSILYQACYKSQPGNRTSHEHFHAALDHLWGTLGCLCWSLEMPHLYIFAICNEIILDKNDMASLIALFNEIEVSIPGGTEVPPNAVVPKEWSLYTSWRQEPEDAGKQYRQIVEIFYPDGTLFTKAAQIDFTFEPGKPYFHTSAKANGFPIGQTGMCSIMMRLEHMSSVVCGPFSIGMNIKHRHQAAPVP